MYVYVYNYKHSVHYTYSVGEYINMITEERKKEIDGQVKSLLRLGMHPVLKFYAHSREELPFIKECLKKYSIEFIRFTLAEYYDVGTKQDHLCFFPEKNVLIIDVKNPDEED